MKISDNPLVSIITVVFNSEKYLEGTIQSIVSQQADNVEYIIVDGASTDGTKDIITNNLTHIHQWISEPDKGLYDAMNKGLKMAKGEYVWFINSGDKLFSDTTIKELTSIVDKEDHPDVIYGETIIIDEQDKYIGPRRLKTPEQLTWKSLIDGLVVCHQSFVVKRSIAPQYNLKYKIAADYDWVLSCLKYSGKIHNSGLVLSRYLDNGLSKNNIPKALYERFKIMINNFGWIKTLGNHFLISLRFFYFVFRNKRF
ncbi:MAG: glycosyltransferase family 2 protein [Bacteroidales bacterium]|nr:glycosyltransferase family 2 protein [Bacteroidales bacterium]